MLEPGWRWSEHVKPLAGTEWCEAPHVQYHVAGALRIIMADGTEFAAHPGEVTSLPAGHDAYVVGDEPVIVFDWYGASAPVFPKKVLEMPRLQGKSFDSPNETRTPAKARIELVTLGRLTFARGTLEPGWRWSSHVKPVVGLESCQRRHVKFFVSGRQRIRMDDGTEIQFGPGDVCVIDPGHDGWVVGDAPNVLWISPTPRDRGA